MNLYTWWSWSKIDLSFAWHSIECKRNRMHSNLHDDDDDWSTIAMVTLMQLNETARRRSKLMKPLTRSSQIVERALWLKAFGMSTERTVIFRWWIHVLGKTSSIRWWASDDVQDDLLNSTELIGSGMPRGDHSLVSMSVMDFFSPATKHPYSQRSLCSFEIDLIDVIHFDFKANIWRSIWFRSWSISDCHF